VTFTSFVLAPACLKLLAVVSALTQRAVFAREARQADRFANVGDALRVIHRNCRRPVLGATTGGRGWPSFGEFELSEAKPRPISQ